MNHVSISRHINAVVYLDGVHSKPYLEWHYTTRVPYRFGLLFRNPNGTVAEWEISRDVLWDGLAGPAGEGDVRIRPIKSMVNIEFTSPAGEFVATFHREHLYDALMTTREVCDFGFEPGFIDIDADIRAHFGEEYV